MLVALLAAGCPKAPVLPPPPSVSSAPAAVQLARRDARLSSVRAAAVIRMRIPEGMDGAPGGKVHAEVISAGRPPRARLEVLTPLGTPGATILMSDGTLEVYQPIQNDLLVAPLDSPKLAEAAPFPVPMRSLPALLRGSVPLADGEITEVAAPQVQTTAGDASVAGEAPAEAGGVRAEAATALEVRRDGALVERVTVSKSGGYPLEDVRFAPDGTPQLTIRYENYGAVTTTSGGTIAFPQKIVASMQRAQGTASMEVHLTDVEIAPKLAPDAFTLTFSAERPPRRNELR